MSCSVKSVLKPYRYRVGPEERLPLASQLLPAQPAGPWIRCAASAIGRRVIWAPSKEQPPAESPGLGFGQPFFPGVLCSQSGSGIHPDYPIVPTIIPSLFSVYYTANKPAPMLKILCQFGISRHPWRVGGWTSFSVMTFPYIPLSYKVEAVGFGLVIQLLQQGVHHGGQHMQSTLVAQNRETVQVMAVEDREADTNQRNACGLAVLL